MNHSSETAPTKEPRTFSLSELSLAIEPISLACPSLIVAQGTTGRKVVKQMVSKLVAAGGGEMLPSVQVAVLDTDCEGIGALGEYVIPLGEVDGAGTDPLLGIEVFEQQFPRIMRGMKNRLVALAGSADNSLPNSFKQAVDFHLIAGCGGTAGGGQQALINVFHRLAHDFGIIKPRVHSYFLGPEMALRDIGRTPTAEQKAILRDTFAINLQRVQDDQVDGEMLRETCPDGVEVAIRARDRILSCHLYDQSNGDHDYLKIDDYIDMVATQIFYEAFTESGMYFSGRYRDDIGTGITSSQPS